MLIAVKAASGKNRGGVARPIRCGNLKVRAKGIGAADGREEDIAELLFGAHNAVCGSACVLCRVGLGEVILHDAVRDRRFAVIQTFVVVRLCRSHRAERKRTD